MLCSVWDTSFAPFSDSLDSIFLDTEEELGQWVDEEAREALRHRFINPYGLITFKIGEDGEPEMSGSDAGSDIRVEVS